MRSNSLREGCYAECVATPPRRRVAEGSKGVTIFDADIVYYQSNTGIYTFLMYTPAKISVAPPMGANTSDAASLFVEAHWPPHCCNQTALALCNTTANKRLGLKEVPSLVLVLQKITNKHVKFAPAQQSNGHAQDGCGLQTERR